MMTGPTPPALKQRLDPHEDVLWWGRPPRGIMLRKADWLVVPFSIAWCGMVLGAANSNWAKDASLFGTLFLLFFLAVGLYMLVGRFIHDGWLREHTFYAVTPTRALIVTRKAVQSIALDRLAEISLSESRDGSGSIVFGPRTLYDSEGEAISNASGAPAVPTFERIPAAGQVYATIRRAQAELAKAR